MRLLLTAAILLADINVSAQEGRPVLQDAMRAGPELGSAFRSAVGDALRPDEARRLDAWAGGEQVDPESAAGTAIRVALATYVTHELLPGLLRATHHPDVAETLAHSEVNASTHLTDLFYRHLRDRADIPVAISNDYGLLASNLDSWANPAERARLAADMGRTPRDTLIGVLRSVGRYLGQLVRNARNLHAPESIFAHLWRH